MKLVYNKLTKNFSSRQFELRSNLQAEFKSADDFMDSTQKEIEKYQNIASESGEEYKVLNKLQSAIEGYNSIIRQVDRMKLNNDEKLNDQSYWTEDFGAGIKSADGAIKNYKDQVESVIKEYNKLKSSHLKSTFDGLVKIYNKI